MRKPVIYHIPACPFSQRLKILLNLKGLDDAIDYFVVDITRERPSWLLALTRNSTALPVLETEDGRVIKESLVILAYLEERYPDPPVARPDPYERAVERMLIAKEGPLTATGYGFVMNRNPSRRDEFSETLLRQYAAIDGFLTEHNPAGTYLFDRFGLAEAVFTPLFMRFWFLDYYEGFDLPDEAPYRRVRHWREACLAHPAAGQVTREEIVKLYYDYAQGVGNGALPAGRSVSSFAFEPDWRERPWPPRDKYGHAATDAELGLITMGSGAGGGDADMSDRARR